MSLQKIMASSSVPARGVVGGRQQPQTDRGGYDCEFVTPPPDAIQAECPICLQVLREPCLISCPCGQKICRECVDQIMKDNKPCPLCNLTDFTYIRDHGLERYLKEQGVWCSKKEEGCDWRGKLREYEQHLNQNPSPENQLTGCQFHCKFWCVIIVFILAHIKCVVVPRNGTLTLKRVVCWDNYTLYVC